MTVPSKRCFVIAPIGEPGSPERKRSDVIYKHIICPAVESCGYKPLRADRIPDPGIITQQIIQHIVEADLVIADLTGRNPNVFYELAICHALKKPFIQLLHSGERLPFDVAGTRTIFFDHKDLDSADFAKVEIRAQIESLESNITTIETPISMSLELQSLRHSDEPAQRSLAELAKVIYELKASMDAMVHRGNVDQPKNLTFWPLPGILDLAPQFLKNDLLLSSSEAVIALAKVEFVSKYVDPDFLLGVNPSGWLLSDYFAKRLNISVDRILQCSINPRLGKLDFDRKTKLSGVVLVIDDVSRSGRSLSLLRKHINHGYPEASLKVITLVKVVDKHGNSRFPVDYSPYMSTAARVQFPWNSPERREFSGDLFPVFRIGEHAAASIDISPGEIDDLIELIKRYGFDREILTEIEIRRSAINAEGKKR